jgi:hypothetical protein
MVQLQQAAPGEIGAPDTPTSKQLPVYTAVTAMIVTVAVTKLLSACKERSTAQHLLLYWVLRVLHLAAGGKETYVSWLCPHSTTPSTL